jgi:hypothetical protein
MATSIPGQPADSIPGDLTPSERTVTSIAEQIAAIDELLGLARESIRVFDRDLSDMGWNTAARAERLIEFLRRGRAVKLDIIVHDTRWIESSCPRLLNLLRTFGHAITLYKTGPEASAAMDPLVIVDGRHFLHRFHVDRSRAAFGKEQPALARPLATRFDEIWATGEPGLSGTVLGL